MSPARTNWQRWISPRALFAHLLLLIFFPGCLVAGWWQATVAFSGNGLSYLYAFEWPVFAIFSTVLWWNFLHDEPGTYGKEKLVALRRPRPDNAANDRERAVSFRSEDEGEELRNYNDYLEQLANRPTAKTWRRR